MPLRSWLCALSLFALPAYALPVRALLAANEGTHDYQNAPGGSGTGGGSGAGPILKKAAPDAGFTCLPEKCMCEGAAQCLDLGRTGLCRDAVTCTNGSCTCERTVPGRAAPPR